MATPDLPPLPGSLTLEECAAIFKISPRSVRRLVAAGELVAFKAGLASNSPLRVTVLSARAFIARQIQAARSERVRRADRRRG
jgi:hypothetical protein